MNNVHQTFKLACTRIVRIGECATEVASMRGDQVDERTRKHLPGQGHAAAAQDREEAVARRSTHTCCDKCKLSHAPIDHFFIWGRGAQRCPQGAPNTSSRLQCVTSSQAQVLRLTMYRLSIPSAVLRFRMLPGRTSSTRTRARTKNAQLFLRTSMTNCPRDERRPRNRKQNILIRTWRACAQPQTSTTQGTHFSEDFMTYLRTPVVPLQGASLEFEGLYPRA